MHPKSESDLTTLAENCLTSADDDSHEWKEIKQEAWEHFRPEADARYSREDDGLPGAYGERATEIFETAALEVERLHHNREMELEAD